jgi:hypothetical protein
MVGPFLRFGAPLFRNGLPPEQLLVLMLRHAATAIANIVLLTTLTRTPPLGVPVAVGPALG